MRRSLSSEDEIPLDLHVLGLPLAFILSQDQTLHSMIFKLSLQNFLLYLFINSSTKFLTSSMYYSNRVNELLFSLSSLPAKAPLSRNFISFLQPTPFLLSVSFNYFPRPRNLPFGYYRFF